ncbi:hypothetical protein AB0N06_10515 [Streptomyces sp. NPDC051020]|uniref:hypothetical protein n=1 Tax=Streptomyces sp. NPDC051020 TaxID=3155409 RepID=UPI00342B8724
MTVREIRGRTARGTLVVTPPEGMSADRTEVPFTLSPGGAATVPIRLTGTATTGGAAGRVRAVFDAETEAQPRLLQVAVPYASLAAAFNNVGVTADSNPTAGTFTSSGRSYSAQALATLGITRDARVTFGDATFTWPDVPPGSKDNVASTGQVIRLSGQGSRLGFLGSGTYGG